MIKSIYSKIYNWYYLIDKRTFYYKYEEHTFEQVIQLHNGVVTIVRSGVVWPVKIYNHTMYVPTTSPFKNRRYTTILKRLKPIQGEELDNLKVKLL